MISLSVVIPTHNRAITLGETLESVANAERPENIHLECVVVANACTDRSEEVVATWARRVPFPLRCVVVPEAGVNIARNRGVSSSRGDAIVLIDDDELLPEHYLVQATRELEGDTTIAGVGGPCRDYGKGGPKTCANCSLTEVEPPARDRGLVRRLLGGNMAVRRAVFENVGLFDESLSGRGDETEWFSRAHQMRFLYEPELWVWHRRDHFTFPALLQHALKQGRSLPRALRTQGMCYRPRPRMVAGNVWHGLRCGCAAGWMRAARESAAIAAWIKGV